MDYYKDRNFRISFTYRNIDKYLSDINKLYDKFIDKGLTEDDIFLDYKHPHKDKLISEHLPSIFPEIYKRSNVIIVCLDSTYSDSKWFNLEFKVVLNILLEQEVKRIILINFDNCDLPYQLMNRKYLTPQNVFEEKTINEIVTRSNIKFDINDKLKNNNEKESDSTKGHSTGSQKENDFSNLYPSNDIVPLPEYLKQEELELKSPDQVTTFFPPNLALVERKTTNCDIDRLKKKLLSNEDLIVFTGSQQTGKTWLARSLVKAIFDEKGLSVIDVPVSPYVFHTIIEAYQEKDSPQHYVDGFEYLIYAYWAQRFVRDILYNINIVSKEKQNKILKENSLIFKYMENEREFFEDIIKTKKEIPAMSVFSILGERIFYILSVAKIQAKMLLFIEIEDFHAYKDQHKLEGAGQKAMKKFLDELKLAQNEPSLFRPLNVPEYGWFKLIVTTRQIEEIISKKRGRKHPQIDLSYFTLEECSSFIHENLEGFDYKETEKIVKEAYYVTSGYPWFFHRWVRSFVFIYLNYKKMDFHEIFSCIRECGVFWYYKNPFNQEFGEILQDYNYIESPSKKDDMSLFLLEIKEYFEQNIQMLTWYKDNFTYFFDESKNPQQTKRGSSQSLTLDNMNYALALVRLGLIEYNELTSIFRAKNPIIEIFFNPSKIERLIQ